MPPTVAVALALALALALAEPIAVPVEQLYCWAFGYRAAITPRPLFPSEREARVV
jgi:hypothetical protein